MAKSSTTAKTRRTIVENGESLQILERGGVCDTIHRYANAIPIDSASNPHSKLLQPVVTNCNKQAINDIRTVMRNIADSISNTTLAHDNNPYLNQRTIISNLFSDTSKQYSTNPTAAIMQRLIVLDSLYSTNASYNYFAFENMAKAISKLGNESDAIKYFSALVTGYAKNNDKLFCSQYGIRKNLTPGSRQMSLMTKYAYYQLIREKEKHPLGFPIYDSLVIAVYPEIHSWIFNTEKKLDSSNSIVSYINNLDVLRGAIFETEGIQLVHGMQQFDLLDAYMWRMGKIDEGNYSLLFDEADYKTFVGNIGLSINKAINYEENIYQSFKQAQCKGKRLVTFVEKSLKNGKPSKQYKYDFNALTRYQCANMQTKDILHGIKNHRPAIESLIEHWKKYYKPNNDYK